MCFSQFHTRVVFLDHKFSPLHLSLPLSPSLPSSPPWPDFRYSPVWICNLATPFRILLEFFFSPLVSVIDTVVYHNSLRTYTNPGTRRFLGTNEHYRTREARSETIGFRKISKRLTCAWKTRILHWFGKPLNVCFIIFVDINFSLSEKEKRSLWFQKIS